MKKKLFIILIAILSIFCYTGNTFSSKKCNENGFDFCLDGKIIAETKGISGEKKIDELIVNGVNYLLGFLLLISIIYGTYGAWNIFSAMSDDDKVQKGKTIIIRACIGLVIIFSAYTITNFVINGFLFQEEISKKP